MEQPIDVPRGIKDCLGLPGEDFVCVACGESRPESDWPSFWKRSEPKTILDPD